MPPLLTDAVRHGLTATSANGRKTHRERLRVAFAPDWTTANPYQRLLAAAVSTAGVDVILPQGSRRGLPLTRGLAPLNSDIVHLHWPEAYSSRGNGICRGLRCLRFQFDLRLATRRRPLVRTLHNLLPHGDRDDAPARMLQRLILAPSSAIIVHSQAVADRIERTRNVSRRVFVVPHGDLSIALGPPVPRGDARRKLGLDTGPLCLMFGSIEPYKGVEEIIEQWPVIGRNARLVIIGKSYTTGYGKRIDKIGGMRSGVEVRSGCLSDQELRLWLSAADCALFNYTRITTSGGASLARSYGLPLFFPSRLDLPDLGEPCPRVLRFRSIGDLRSRIVEAVSIGRDYASAADWREANNWCCIGRRTAEIYRSVLNDSDANDSTVALAAVQ